jgi:hypothetical protein
MEQSQMNEPWLPTARSCLVSLLKRAEDLGAALGGRVAAGEDAGPDPKAVEALTKLISAVSDVVTGGEVLEKGGGSDE